MLELPKGQTTDAERDILRKLRVWIAALAVACLVVGLGVGAMLTGRQTIAQSEAQIARAPEALSASFAEIARRVEPSVVKIRTVGAPQDIASVDTDEDEPEAPGEADKNQDKKKNEGEEGDEEGQSKEPKLPPGHPLLEMFRNRQRAPSRGVGSGFIIDPKGLILTNQHVVEGANRIIVSLTSGEVLRGEVVGVDDETDIAVIKVNAARDLPSVKLGNSDESQVGDWVLAIGSPFDLDHTVTAGIISTKERRTPGASNFQQFLQTDAAINRGNSGGPLVNMRGEVIGINSQIATSTGDYNGIGFALPANEAKFVYNQIVAGGKVRRGYLGVLLQPVQAEFARVYGLPEAKGAIIGDVADDEGPAAKAGIQVNDIVVEFNGRAVANSQDLINKVASTPVGQAVQLTYLRDINGKLERRTANVTLGERPSRASVRRTSDETERIMPLGEPKEVKPKTEETSPGVARPKLGLTLSELTPQLANERNLKGVRGLLVRDVDPGGLASDAGIERGLVIQRINRVTVTSLAEFERVVNALKPGDAVVLHIATASGERVQQGIIQFTYQ